MQTPGETNKLQNWLRSALSIRSAIRSTRCRRTQLKGMSAATTDAGLLFYEELQVLIENHLEDLENNRLCRLIVKKTGFSLETIQEAWEDLRTLKPKPGSEFNDNFAPSVTPDVFVDRREGPVATKCGWKTASLPSLYISNYLPQAAARPYAPMPRRATISSAKINSAQWIIEAIEQRRSTLTRVCRRRSSITRRVS